MKIVVCSKQVAHVYHASAVNLASGAIDPARVVFMPDPGAEVAVEVALRIAAAHPGSEITLVTAGDAAVEPALRAVAAMGGARITRLLRVDVDVADGWSTATALAAVLAGCAFDLVLCGRRAIDTNAGLVGTFIAELLDLPQVSGVVGIELPLGAGEVVVERALGRGDREEVACDLPALLAVEATLAAPRYPTLADRRVAEAMAIEVVVPALDAVEPSVMARVKKYSLPRPKTRQVFTPDSSLSVDERMRQIMSGGTTRKEGGEMVSGAADDAAACILAFLREQQFLP